MGGREINVVLQLGRLADTLKVIASERTRDGSESFVLSIASFTTVEVSE